MDFEIDNMDIHFNKCAPDYDGHFYNDLGMCEFYDEIEKQINTCGNPKNFLVLGCGTGLEIERIKYSAIVTAIDISPGMLAEFLTWCFLHIHYIILQFNKRINSIAKYTIV